MATPASTVIDRVLNKFRYKDPVTTLTGSLTNAVTSGFVDDFLPNIGRGSIIQIDEEYFLVHEIEGTNPMKIYFYRSWLGSTAATHANAAPVYVNPRVLGTEVLDFINECLDQIYPKVYVIGETTITYSGSSIGYELPADVGFVFRVDGEQDSSSKHWKEIGDIRYIPQADTTDFPNGKAIMLRTALPFNASFRVMYGKGFTRVAASTDDLEAVAGLQTYMMDLPYYYAMHKLMADKEVDRSDSSGASSHQRAQDVPSYVSLRTADWYKVRYNELLESARIRQRFEIGNSAGIGGYGN